MTWFKARFLLSLEARAWAFVKSLLRRKARVGAHTTCYPDQFQAICVVLLEPKQ
jgi:hypothetical protein